MVCYLKNSPARTEITCTHTTQIRAESLSTRMMSNEEEWALVCNLQVHPKLHTCNAILYQVGRIDWGGEGAELKSVRERE